MDLLLMITIRYYNICYFVYSKRAIYLHMQNAFQMLLFFFFFSPFEAQESFAA